MVRTYHRKTEKVPREILIGALRHLKLLDNLKLKKIAYRKVAEGFGIPVNPFQSLSKSERS